MIRGDGESYEDDVSVDSHVTLQSRKRRMKKRRDSTRREKIFLQRLRLGKESTKPFNN